MTSHGKLHRKMGCEWTWQTSDGETCVTFEQANQVADYLQRNRVKTYNHAHIDDFCLEIATPPCSTLLELKQYWEAYQAATKPLGLIRQSVGRTSGGGHIHINCPHTREGLRLAQKCVAWAYINPWIGWVFNDPVDDESAKSPEGFYYNGVLDFLKSDYTASSLDEWTIFSRAGQYDKHTIEFRALDMPKTWSEAERHICFTDALIEHIDKLKLEQIEITVRLNNKLPLAKELAARWPYTKSAAAFEALVKDLGLPWEHYRYYLHNLKQRYRLGTTN